MQRLRLIRYAMLEVVLPSAVGLAGLLFLFGVGRDELLVWHAPLIGGMFATALAGLGGGKGPPAEEPPP